MLKNKKIAIVGGDERQRALADYIAKDEKVFVYASPASENKNIIIANTLEAAVKGADIILLPLPSFEKDLSIKNSGGVTLAEIAKYSSGALFMGGVTANAENEAKRLNLTLIDYYKDELLQQLNAIPTAEGAIAVAMKSRKKTLAGSKILITGYGRIGKHTAKLAAAFGAKVFVAVRSAIARSEAEAQGYTSADIYNMNGILPEIDIIFNTVPSEVFLEEQLSQIKKDAILIELASAPYGVEFCKAEKAGINVILAASLPGKVAPVTAGEAIGETVKEILKKRENV